MNGYKALLCAVLGVCLLLCGCAGQTAAPDTAAATAEEAADTNRAAGWVETARDETFRHTDKSGNEITAVYRIPKLTADTIDAQRMNADINGKYNKLFDEARETAAQNGSPEPETIDYSAYLNDDIVTIVITGEGQSHSMTYEVYNYNKTTGKRLNNVELLNYLQRSYDDTFQALGKALEADYTSKFKEENFPDDYYYRLDLTLKETAVRQSKLFLNQNGELYAVCTEYADVGDGAFQVLIRC